MTEEEKNIAIAEAVDACLNKAADILKANKGGVRALFAVYADPNGTFVTSLGHTIALDTAYQQALLHVACLLEPL